MNRIVSVIWSLGPHGSRSMLGALLNGLGLGFLLIMLMAPAVWLLKKVISPWFSFWLG